MSVLSAICIDRQIEALQGLRKILDTSEYKHILELIIDVAKDEYRSRVLIAGVGKNSNIASKISETMVSLGIPSFPINVSHLGHGDYGCVGYQDIIIHISRSGETSEMMEAIRHLRKIRPSTVQVLIHCKNNKPVNKDVDVELFIGTVKEGDLHGLAPTTSTTALLCILDCLSVEASAEIGFDRLDFLKFHPSGTLGAMLTAEQKDSK